MIIGISGKIGNGKDTIGKIIQYLTNKNLNGTIRIEHYLEGCDICEEDNTWDIKKFADKLKDTICSWTGCTREQLEDHTFKDTEIGEEWIRYGYADGFEFRYKNGDTDVEPERVMNYVSCDKETYEYQKRINWQTAYKKPLTYRLLMQLLGTECMRNTIHPNGWVNSLMNGYKSKFVDKKGFDSYEDNGSKISFISMPLTEPNNFPNWIITDLRFPNELDAIKSRGGISIRVNRPYDSLNQNSLMSLQRQNDTKNHLSETKLDNATFDYVIENNGTLEELIERVKEILIKEKII